jgi:hypothetical protein
VWRLPQLLKKYPDAIYVHLIRDKEPCVISLSKRSSLDHYVKFTERTGRNKYSRKVLASNYYDFVVSTVDMYFNTHPVESLVMHLVPTRNDWNAFCKLLGVSDEDALRSYAEWGTKYNK